MTKKIDKAKLREFSTVINKYIGETEKNLHAVSRSLSDVKNKVSELMRTLNEEETTDKS